jgi:hypothetical protein
MTTVTDPKIYVSKEVTCKDETRNCLRKTATIKGVAGKQIKIDAFNVAMENAKAGINTTLTITLEKGGKEVPMSIWIDNKDTYIQKVYTFKYIYMADPGEDFIIRWYLRTANASYEARMKDCSYTYSLVDVPVPDPVIVEPEPPVTEPEPDTPTYVMILCDSKEDAENLKTDLTTHIGERQISIWSRNV